MLKRLFKWLGIDLDKHHCEIPVNMYGCLQYDCPFEKERLAKRRPLPTTTPKAPPPPPRY